MAFYGYSGGADDRYWPPYTSEFGVPPQYSSPYELGNPNPLDYASSAYYEDHFSAPITYASSYDFYEYPSQTIYSQPKLLQYEPSPTYQGSEIKFAISYSKAEDFSEPEFEEYDPTPYDGGYDQRMTYGKPLPPSDLTCYPRSLPQPDSLPLENFSYNSIPSPYGKDDNIPIEPPKGRKPTDTKGETESHVENGGKDVSDGKEADIVDAIPMGDYEQQKGFENGSGGDYAHVSQIPYGSGLEAMDLCESIFGYWPCLAKKAQQQRNSCQVCDQDRRMDPWEAAADYFFGNPVPYDYDYYRHHQSPYQSDQVSWLQ